MIVMTGRVHLAPLGIANTFHLALPDSAVNGDQRLPYAVCLHGYGQNGERLLQQTNWESYVEKTRTALLFPDGQNSCFMDMAYGPAWESYLLNGLLPYAERTFPLCGRPALLGDGTGGWAAARLAAHWPERFRACGAANADRDLIAHYAAGQLADQPDLEAVFGDPDALRNEPLYAQTVWREGPNAMEAVLEAMINNDGSTIE